VLKGTRLCGLQLEWTGTGEDLLAGFDIS